MLLNKKLTLVSYTARMTGQVLGVGIVGAITQSILARNLESLITGPDSNDVSAVSKSHD